MRAFEHFGLWLGRSPWGDDTNDSECAASPIVGSRLFPEGHAVAPILGVTLMWGVTWQTATLYYHLIDARAFLLAAPGEPYGLPDDQSRGPCPFHTQRSSLVIIIKPSFHLI